MRDKNPLAGIDDLITKVLLTNDTTTKKTTRQAIREKVAQATLLIVELIELKQDKEADDVLTISRKRMRYFTDLEAKYAALEAAGVDNWEGYADAMAQTKE